MTASPDPRRVTAALSMVKLSVWGMHANVLELVRLKTLDERADWFELSQKNLAHWLHTDPRHARRLLAALVSHFRVLERDPGAGSRGAAYRFRDPLEWRWVPWRIPPDNETGRPPELVAHRLDAACGSVVRAEPTVVTRYQRATKQISDAPPARRNLALWRAPSASRLDHLQRASSAPQTADRPSSTSSELTGSAPTPHDGQKTEEAGCAGEGPITLRGAAEEVRRAVVRTGMGPVNDTLRRRLAAPFADVSVDVLGPIFAGIRRAAANGQKPPALVDMAIDMLDAGVGQVLTGPAVTGRSPEAVLAELYDHEAAVAIDLKDAENEGDELAAGYFREQLATCQDRIRRITGEAV